MRKAEDGRATAAVNGRHRVRVRASALQAHCQYLATRPISGRRAEGWPCRPQTSLLACFTPARQRFDQAASGYHRHGARGRLIRQEHGSWPRVSARPLANTLLFLVDGFCPLRPGASSPARVCWAIPVLAQPTGQALGHHVRHALGTHTHPHPHVAAIGSPHGLFSRVAWHRLLVPPARSSPDSSPSAQHRLKHPRARTATTAPTDRSYQPAIMIRVNMLVPARCKIYEDAMAACSVRVPKP